ncbi:MAG: ABC transporter permease [Thalassobaculales bacterium]
MFSFIVNRLIATVPVMLVVAVFVFLLLRLTPGDPAAILAGDAATPEQVRAIRLALGLEEPIHIQFVTWMGQILTGNLGTSIISKLPVIDLIGQRVYATLSLASTTIVFSVLVAVPLGVVAAWFHDTLVDRLVMVFAVLGFSVPVFVLGYAYIYQFAIVWKLLPVQGYMAIDRGLWPWLERLILPTATLSVIYIALIARITRASMLEILTEDYVRTARAKGLPERVVLVRHALRNAAVPIVTVIGIGIALLISGVVVTETVYNIPGLGRLTVDAVLARDYPTIQGLILVFAFVYVLINLMIDIAYTLLDPRIRY